MTLKLIEASRSSPGGVRRYEGAPPPPPGVSTTSTSPGPISAVSTPVSAITVPSARSTRLLPHAPGRAPAIPYGAIRRCPDSTPTVIGCHAGTDWVDEATVVDGNLISARTPADLGPWMKALLAALEKNSG